MEKITFLKFKRKTMLTFRLVVAFFIVTIASSFVDVSYPITIYNIDTDTDGISDNVDIDDDGDGIIDSVEDANLDGDNDHTTNPTDTDKDGIPNYLDIDSDGDTIVDNVEAQLVGAYQAPCGIDTDGNGLDDHYENTPGSSEGLSPVSTDGDVIPNYLDIDSDNDGILDRNECKFLSVIQIYAADFGFPAGVNDGSLSGSNLDISSKWGLPLGSIVIGVSGVGTHSSGYTFSIRDGLPATFTVSGTVPVMSIVQHSSRVGAMKKDGVMALDGAKYIQKSILPAGVISGNTGNDYYVKNTTTVDIEEFNRFIWESETPISRVKFYTTASGIDSGIRISLRPLICSDSDNDGIPNHLDIDSDNDGLPDNVEAQTTSGYIAPTGLDDDNDGLDNAYEGSGNEGLTPVNTDGEDNADYLDIDSDNDTVLDNNEGNDFDFDGIPDQSYTGVDTDGDGL
ncbi:MAG: hypothetical protein V3U92_09320, partial [Cellulophaga sp.]